MGVSYGCSCSFIGAGAMIIETLKEYGEIIWGLLSLIFFAGLIIFSCRKKPITEHNEVGYEAADIKVNRDDK